MAYFTLPMPMQPQPPALLSQPQTEFSGNPLVVPNRPGRFSSEIRHQVGALAPQESAHSPPEGPKTATLPQASVVNSDKPPKPQAEVCKYHKINGPRSDKCTGESTCIYSTNRPVQFSIASSKKKKNPQGLTRTICSFHQKYGLDSRKCIPPCSFEGLKRTTAPRALEQAPVKKARLSAFQPEVVVTDSDDDIDGFELKESSPPPSPPPRQDDDTDEEADGLCVYHKQFGDGAILCNWPCTFKAKGVESGGRRTATRRYKPSANSRPSESSTPRGGSDFEEMSENWCTYHRKWGPKALHCRRPCTYQEDAVFPHSNAHR